MTEKVNPSINRPAEAFKTAGAIALAGGMSEGWISPSASPSDIAVQDGGISESNLNAFSQTSSGTSFDVDISGGEAFIYGSWLAIDTVTTVTLASSTNNQTVYVGWNKDGTDDVIIGLQSAFDSASGNTDEKIPLYDFDTDGSGVTNVTDRRTIGKTLDGRFVNNTASVSTNYTTSGEQLVFVDSSGGAVTVTLSTADLDQGSNVIVVDSGGAAKTNNITINTEGSASINGATSTTIEDDYGAKAVASDGSNWFTSGAGGGGGAFSDADGDGIAELADTFSGIQLDSDERVELSTDGSVHMRYDSTADGVRIGGNTEPAGTVQSQFASPSGGPGGVGVESTDSVWNADSAADSIYELNRSGTVQGQFAAPSSSPQGIGLDSIDSIWNADLSADSIYSLNQSGTVQTQFLSPSSEPRGVGIDSADCIWHSDSIADSIYQLNQSGTIQTGFVSPSNAPIGVGVDSSDCIWNSDNSATSIYKLNQSGTVQSGFASPSGGPKGVGFDSNGSIWHADALADSIYEIRAADDPDSDIMALDRSTGDLTIEGTLTEGKTL